MLTFSSPLSVLLNLSHMLKCINDKRQQHNQHAKWLTTRSSIYQWADIQPPATYQGKETDFHNHKKRYFNCNVAQAENSAKPGMHQLHTKYWIRDGMEWIFNFLHNWI